MYSVPRLKFNLFTFLIGVNVVMFLLVTLLKFILPPELTLSYLFYSIIGSLIPSFVLQGDWWSLVTSNFLHVDILHFALNMLSLWILGRVVYDLYDGKKLFSVYIITGIAGMILSVVMYASLGRDIPSLGASASIFGVVGLIVGGIFKRQRFGRPLPISLNDILPSVALSLFAGFLSPGINNWAHLGGLISGIILGLFITHSVGDYSSKLKKNVEGVLFYFSMVIFVLAYIFLVVNGIRLLYL